MAAPYFRLLGRTPRSPLGTSETIDGAVAASEDSIFSPKSGDRGSMRVKFWGVRGSTPTPQAENLRYGGNTSCVEVRIDDQIYVFDCGTGFRNLGKHLLQEFAGKPVHAHVFLSHFHWDHIQGIPFFGPLYSNPDNYFFFHSS